MFDPVEQARAKRALGLAFLGLILVLAATGIVQFITGKSVGDIAATICGDSDMCRNAVTNSITFLQYLAILIFVLAIIWNGIRLKTTD